MSSASSEDHTEPGLRLSSPVAGCRPQRADARRNRVRVLDAARECFAGAGLDTAMEDVARCAGVGMGTVYRHFPTKEALVQALVAERFEQFARYAAEALDEADPWQALTGFMRRCARLQADDRALSAILTRMPSAMAAGAANQTELTGHLAELVGRAQAAGAVRADVGWEDVPMIMCGVGGQVQSAGAGGPGDWERHLALVLDGLRAPGAEPLPARRAQPAAARS